MKNRILLAFSLCMLFSLAQAQLITGELPRNEFAFNATRVVQKIFAITPIESDIKPYIIQYRKINWETNWANRAAIGFNLFFDTSQSPSFLERKTSESNFRIRVGREKRIPVSEKLYFILGLDAFGQINRQKVVSNTNPVTSTIEVKYTPGVSPVFGLSLRFAERATLSLESSFSIYYQHRKSTTETNNGQPPTIFENQSVNSSIDQPFGLYFGFIF